MDGFQIRLELLHLLKYLNASQQSIQKVLTFAMKHASKAEDVWSCIVSQCEKSTLNSKLNVLFLIDSLLTDDSGHSSPAIAAITYGPLAQRDLRTIILDLVVPKENWDAVRLNAGSAQQILNSWRHKRLFDSTLLDEVDSELEVRRKQLRTLPPSESASYGKFSKTEVLKRMEEDRERHKRLRERIWILPPKSFVDSLPSTSTSKSVLSSPSSQLRVIGSPKEPGSSTSGGVKDIRAVGVARAASNASKANNKRESSNTTSNARKKRKGDIEDPLLALIGSPSDESSSINEEQEVSIIEDNTSNSNSNLGNINDQQEPSSPSSFLSKGLDSLDVEFEEAWETTSDLNEDDLENILEEEMKWWGGEEGFKNTLREKELQEEELRKGLESGIGVRDENGLEVVPSSSQSGQMEISSSSDPSGQLALLQQQEQQRLIDQENLHHQLLSQEEQMQQQFQNGGYHQHQQQQQQFPTQTNFNPNSVPIQHQNIPSGPSGYGNNYRGGRMGRPPSQRGGFNNNNQVPYPNQNPGLGSNPQSPGINGNGGVQPPTGPAGGAGAGVGRGGIRPIGIMNRGSAHVGRGRGRGWR